MCRCVCAHEVRVGAPTTGCRGRIQGRLFQQRARRRLCREQRRQVRQRQQRGRCQALLVLRLRTRREVRQRLELAAQLANLRRVHTYAPWSARFMSALPKHAPTIQNGKHVCAFREDKLDILPRDGRQKQTTCHTTH